MPISQLCGFCGSSFEVTSQREVALWREWVATHKCEASNDVTETPIMTSADTVTDRIGFQMRSLNIELPDKPGWEDE
jgi:hypothetical protein